MSTALNAVREKHREQWAAQPPWAATTDAAAAAAARNQHAAELRTVGETLRGTAACLEETRQQLLAAAAAREEAVARAAALELQCASLAASVCEMQRKCAGADSATGSGNASSGDGAESTAPATTQQQQQHPRDPHAASLMRMQNDSLLATVRRLSAELGDARSQIEQQRASVDANRTSCDAAGAIFEAQVAQFVGHGAAVVSFSADAAAANDTRTADAASFADSAAALDVLDALRAQLAAAEERALVAERVAAVSAAALAALAPAARGADGELNATGGSPPRSAPRRRGRDAGLRDGDAAGGDADADTDGASPLQGRDPRSSSTARDGHRDAPASSTLAAAAAATASATAHAGDAVPASTSELLRYWAAGHYELADLRRQLERALQRADESDRKAGAAAAMASTRAELVANLQALAAELEASRDESTRLRCVNEGLELHVQVLTAHLTSALASAMSAAQVELAAAALKEAAAKTATIAALTAPEMSVAKDAMKRNQALQHELTLMAKRRDDLRDDIASKQRALEHIAGQQWLRGLRGDALRAAEIVAAPSPLPAAQQQQQQQGKQPQSSLRNQVVEMQRALSERDAVIHGLRRELAAVIAAASSQQDAARANAGDDAGDDDDADAAVERGSGGPASTAGNVGSAADASSSHRHSHERDQDAVVGLAVTQDAALRTVRGELRRATATVAEQRAFGECLLGTVQDVSTLTQQVMGLLDTMLATHAVFAPAPVAHANANCGGDGAGADQPQQVAAPSSTEGSLSADEAAVVRQVLAALDGHRALVGDRLALLGAFQHVGEVTGTVAACGVLERRTAELSDAKRNAAALLQRLEGLEKDAAAKAQWYGVVDGGVAALRRQGEALERDNVAAWALFSDMALHRLDTATRDLVGAAKPPVAALLLAGGAGVAAAAVVESVGADAAKAALRRGAEFLVAAAPAATS